MPVEKEIPRKRGFWKSQTFSDKWRIWKRGVKHNECLWQSGLGSSTFQSTWVKYKYFFHICKYKYKFKYSEYLEDIKYIKYFFNQVQVKYKYVGNKQ